MRLTSTRNPLCAVVALTGSFITITVILKSNLKCVYFSEGIQAQVVLVVGYGPLDKPDASSCPSQVSLVFVQCFLKSTETHI